MSPIRFTLEEREELKTKMFSVSMEILKHHGMKHTSVEKITQAVDIGRSTFYNFFASKEVFIYELMLYQRDQAKQVFNELIKEKEEITTQDCKEYFMSLYNAENVYQYLTVEDEYTLSEKIGIESVFDPEEDSRTIDTLLENMKGVRADFDRTILLNLLKICALAKESKELLYQNTLDASIELILDRAFSYISK